MNDTAALRDHLLRLEETLADPGVRRSPDELARLLADDFREFGSSGRVFDKVQIIQALQEQQTVKLWLEHPEMIRVAPDGPLVTHRGKAQFPGSRTISQSRRSSIWRHRGGRWEVVCHQGTVCS